MLLLTWHLVRQLYLTRTLTELVALQAAPIATAAATGPTAAAAGTGPAPGQLPGQQERGPAPGGDHHS